MITIERFTRSDWKWPAVFLGLGLAGALVARQFFFQAFPEASIRLELPRDEIARRSESFLRGRGIDPTGFRSVTLFEFSDSAKTYLERELGLAEANRVMASQVNIWRWRTRWLKPPEKEEMSVWLNPAGQLVGFEHQVDEKREAPRLEKEEARRIAEVFLRAERGLDLARYDLVTDEARERPNRLDYTFTWEEKGLRLKNATRRMGVTVLGDQVGGFTETLKVPEQWLRDYERLRSRNNLLQVIATVLFVGLHVLVAITLIRSSRQGLPWRALIGIAAVAAVLYMGQFWNEFGLQLRLMPTNIPYEVWTTFYLIGMVGVGLLLFLYVYFLAAGGEPLYRGLAPERVSLGRLFTFQGIRSKEFFRSTLIGYGMAGFHIGAVVLFYVVAQRLGAWTPLDVKYSNALSTPLPWLQPMSTSVLAATTEEFAFRLFAIPLLLKWTRSKWIAIIVPAFAWGFLHSAYPQQPPWIRGFEVGLIGILAGWVFLRFGILATLVWHYTVDAVLIGLFLFRSEELTYRIAGVLVGDALLLPLVIGGVFYLQSRGFVRDERILNAAPEKLTPEAEPEARVLAEALYAGTPRPWIARLALAGLAGLVVVALVKVPSVGNRIRIAVPPARAEAAARDHLVRRGVKTEQYRSVTSLTNDIAGSPAEYLRERRDTRWVAQVYAEQVPAVFWQTRFFRPLQKEEYTVFTSPDGSVFRHVHQLDEKAPGDTLGKPEARALAETFLAEEAAAPRPRLEDYRLVEHRLERRDARNDHTLVWESRAPLVDEAFHRISVGVKGHEVTGPRHAVKVPEDWQRRHTRPTVFTILPVIVGILLGIAGLVPFARALPRTAVRWRFHMTLGVVAAAIQLVQVVNSWPAFMAAYDTSIPWATMVVFLIGGQLMLLLSIFGAVALLGGVAETLLGLRFGRIAWWPSDPGERGRALLTGLALGISAAIVSRATSSLAGWAAEAIPSPVRGLGSGLPGYAPALLPGLSVALDALQGGITKLLAVGVAAGIAFRLFPARGAIAIGLLVAAACFSAGAISAMAFAKSWLSLAVWLGTTAGLVMILRFNLVAYLAWGAFSALLGAAGGMWRHEGLRPFAVQGVVLLGVAMLVVAAIGTARAVTSRAPASGGPPGAA